MHHECPAVERVVGSEQEGCSPRRRSRGRDLPGHRERHVATGRLRPIARYFYTWHPSFPNSLEKVKELSLICRGPFPAGILSPLESWRTCSSGLGHKVAQCSYTPLGVGVGSRERPLSVDQVLHTQQCRLPPSISYGVGDVARTHRYISHL